MKDDVQSISDLDQAQFFGDVLGELAGTLEDLIGVEDAAGFIADAGSGIGRQFSRRYGVSRGTPPRAVAQTCRDLKERVGGAFEIESATDREITMIGHECPFGGRESGRPSLCMMTTNVFGRIAADSAGYANVRVSTTRALGDPVCRISIRFVPTDDGTGTDFFA